MAAPPTSLIQPLTISYTACQGLPVSRNERSDISGMNARGFRAVVGNLLTSGVKEVTIAFGAPIPFDTRAPTAKSSPGAPKCRSAACWWP